MMLKMDIVDIKKLEMHVFTSVNMGFVCLSIKILVFLLVYYFATENGYQKDYGLSSSVFTKIKGVGMTNIPNNQRMIWDIADSVVPPQEEDGVFITTNFVETKNQTQGVCPEYVNVTNSICKTDADCHENRILYKGNGFMTGKCVPASANSDIKTCEIKSWCPLEVVTNHNTEANIIKEVLNYTILIKNSVIFDEINVNKSNLCDCTSKDISIDCIYNDTDEWSKCCPIFKVSTFINEKNETELTNLLRYGGLIRVILTWDCNLDESINNCILKYSFSRLLNHHTKFNRGINFRYANYYINNTKEYRTLFKVYGLKILIEVRGKARKSDSLTFVNNVGSIWKFLAIANIICDLLMKIFLAYNDRNNIQNVETSKGLTRNEQDIGSGSCSMSIEQPDTCCSATMKILVNILIILAYMLFDIYKLLKYTIMLIPYTLEYLWDKLEILYYKIQEIYRNRNKSCTCCSTMKKIGRKILEMIWKILEMIWKILEMIWNLLKMLHNSYEYLIQYNYTEYHYMHIETPKSLSRNEQDNESIDNPIQYCQTSSDRESLFNETRTQLMKFENWN